MLRGPAHGAVTEDIRMKNPAETPPLSALLLSPAEPAAAGPHEREEDSVGCAAQACDAMCFNMPGTLSRDGQPARTGIAALSYLQWIILFLLNAIGPFSSDAYLPALPQIECELQTSSEWASLTIQINWIVLGLMNPVVGIMSDKFGRKNVIYGSMLMFSAGAIGCALATTIELLMAARIVMGIGQAVSVITFAMVRDLIDDQNERMRLLAFFNMMQPLMLLGAPTIGGFIVGFSSWRVLFWVLAGWGVTVAVLVCLFIPETSAAAQPTPLPHSLQLAQPSRCSKIQRLFENGTYVVLTITAGLFMAGVRTMLSTITFIYRQYYCTSLEMVGILVCLPTFAGFLAGSLAGKLSGRKATVQTSNLLCYGMAGGLVAPASLFLSAAFLVPYGWWAVTGPCALMSATGFFCLPAMQVLILDPYKDMSGFAGGLSKMFMTFISTGASMVVSYFYNTTTHSTGCDSKASSDSMTCPDPSLPNPMYFLIALGAVLVTCELVFWLLWALPFAVTQSRAGECEYKAARKDSQNRNENEAFAAAEKRLSGPGPSPPAAADHSIIIRNESEESFGESRSNGASLTPTSAGLRTTGNRG